LYRGCIVRWLANHQARNDCDYISNGRSFLNEQRAADMKITTKAPDVCSRVENVLRSFHILSE